MSPPKLTAEQREAASRRALAARRERARIRRAVSAGEMSVADVLGRSAEDPACANLPVRQLLLSVPGIGAARLAAIMEAVGIQPTRRVRGLGTRQRAALMDIFAVRAGDDR